jgi:hypothetical protein
MPVMAPAFFMILLVNCRAKALERAQAALQESGAETSLHLARTDELMRGVETQVTGE